MLQLSVPPHGSRLEGDALERWNGDDGAVQVLGNWVVVDRGDHPSAADAHHVAGVNLVHGHDSLADPHPDRNPA